MSHDHAVADKFMHDWFGKRWDEDEHLRDVYMALCCTIGGTSKDAVLAERRACAALVEHPHDNTVSVLVGDTPVVIGQKIAAVIRAQT